MTATPEDPATAGHAAVPGPRGESPPPGDGSDSQEELARLRAEVARLRADRGAAGRGPRLVGVRRVVAGVLVFLAAFGIVATVIGGWAARTTLDTDRWVATVAPLPDDPQVNAAVSTYLTREVVGILDVEGRVSTALPPRAAFLAGPLTTQVSDVVRTSVRDVLASPAFSRIWSQANRTAHAQVVAIVEGDGNVVQTSGQRVTLNLLPVVNEVLRELEARVPTIFGQDVNLPPLSSGEVPSAVRDRVETALGVSLPANFAQFTFYDEGRLSAVQDGVVLFKRLVWGLLIGSAVVLALALWISPARRRTTLWFGVWLATAVLVMTALLRAVRDQILGEVPAGEFRSGASAAMHVVFTTLRERGDQLLWAGVVIAVVAYLVGPGRVARRARREGARGARAAATGTRRLAVAVRDEGPGFAARNLDALRVGGLVVGGVVSLWLSSWTGLLVVLVLLAVYEGVVTLGARLAPPPLPGDGPSSVPGEPTTEGRGAAVDLSEASQDPMTSGRRP